MPRGKEIAKIKKKCEYCAVQFIAKRDTRRFCSQRCADKHRNPLKPRRQKKGRMDRCSRCNKEVWTHPNKFRLKRRFCSRGCQIGWMKEMAYRFKCKVCGKVVFVQPCQQKIRNRITCSRECIAKVKRQEAEMRRIELGYTKHQLDRLVRYSKEMKEWRTAVFKRDDYTCQMCGERGAYLEADHIKPFAFFPELRFDLSNGRTLCRECHDKTKMSYKEMRKIYLNQCPK
jgi:5-methylcytosine-specific restriction endonuclease McrA